MEIDFTKIMDRMEKERKQREKRAKANHAPILKVLKSLNATKVEVAYSGSGDSGQVDGVEVYGADNKVIDISDQKAKVTVRESKFVKGKWVEKTLKKELPLADALSDIAIDWSEFYHGGWENNDGASGTLTVDVREGTFHLSHTTYYTESNTDEYDL